MKLGMTGKEIVKTKQGEFWYLFDESQGWIEAEDRQVRDLVKEVYDAFKNKSLSYNDKLYLLKLNESMINSLNSQNSENDRKTTSAALEISKNLINFFSEFYFEPNFRFVNTFCLAAKESSHSAKNYVSSYFELSDSPFTSSLNEKMKSPEFDSIISDITGLPRVKSLINERFKLYYGSQGTGKTTLALKESNGLCMVCHSAMLPSDLMEDFKFVDGKAQFQPSVLQNAMTEGKTIVLDEINLLPFESLRFLQSILDGKEEFSYKGKSVKIAPGFKIIGTMNLVVNGCVYSLPEPLIDRAGCLKKFSLSAADLVGALV